MQVSPRSFVRKTHSERIDCCARNHYRMNSDKNVDPTSLAEANSLKLFSLLIRLGDPVLLGLSARKTDMLAGLLVLLRLGIPFPLFC